MPLFGGKRDAALVKRFNRELVNKIISSEVVLFIISLEETEKNLYGESPKKTYYNPIRMPCLVGRDERNSETDDFGINFKRTAIFSFIRADLKERNILLKEGDILFWDKEYYEIDNVKSEQLWLGKNPETLVSITEGDIDSYGLEVSIVAMAHVTTQSRLNLTNIRTGGGS